VMTTKIFDGRTEARLIEETLKNSGKLQGKKLLILQCDGNSSESGYIRLKREMGEKLGVEVTVEFVTRKDEVKERIKAANDQKIDGILVQLPIKDADRAETEQILSTIDQEKDIDGLNPKSGFVPAVVLAVEAVMEKINVGRDMAIAIVGSEGMVGKRLYDRLIELGFVVSGFDLGDDLMRLRDFDVIISCTGKEDLIKPEMVREGFAGIDLGYPRAGISAEAAEKAGFITPVPGGAGPLTVVSLFENLAETG